MTDTDELERLAASFGDESWEAQGQGVVLRDGNPRIKIAEANPDCDFEDEHAERVAAFIAAAGPATILALLSANREMRGLLQKTTDLLASANRSTDRPSDYVSRVVMEARSALTTQTANGDSQ